MILGHFNHVIIINSANLFDILSQSQRDVTDHLTSIFTGLICGRQRLCNTGNMFYLIELLELKMNIGKWTTQIKIKH